ncbi:MAG: ABC transporter permease, partial [Deltaproteobacteria bacterium]|nr:ABC transporter permease [Deltaproteobacteria bacterium]
MQLITERREISSPLFRFSAPLIALALALFIAGFLLLAGGVNPLQAYREILI